MSGGSGIGGGRTFSACACRHLALLVLCLSLVSSCAIGGNRVSSVPVEWVLGAVQGNFAGMKDYDASGELTITKDRKVYDLSVRMRAVFPSSVRLDMLYGGSMGVMGGKTMAVLIQEKTYVGYIPDENTFFRGTVESDDLEDFALDADVLLILLSGRTTDVVDENANAVRKGDRYIVTTKNKGGRKTIITINAEILVPTKVEVFSAEGVLLTLAEAQRFRRHHSSWVATSFELSKRPGSDKLSLKLEPRSYNRGITLEDLEIEIPEGAIEGELQL